MCDCACVIVRARVTIISLVLFYCVCLEANTIREGGTRRYVLSWCISPRFFLCVTVIVFACEQIQTRGKREVQRKWCVCSLFLLVLVLL